MASAYVLQTMITSTATDTRKKVTFSCWFKRGNLGAYMQLLCNSPNPGSWDCVRINNADKLYLSLNNDTYYLTTNSVFRDVGAWYHVVARVDTTADSADRLQLWVNGVRETSFLTENQPTEDYECNWGVAAQTNRLGMETWGTSQGWNGEMSHVHFCDGFAYDASDFGSFDSTSGIWKIKTGPSVSYGTNGWFLKMEDRSNLDLDSSGNAWSLSTVGTITPTYDNPSNNFCTQNLLQRSDTSSQPTLSNGNTTGIYTSTAGWRTIPGTMAVNKGKWYWEVIGGNSSGHLYPAICSPNWFNGGNPGSYGVSGEPGVGNAGPGSYYQPSYGVYPLNGNLMWQTDSATGTDESYAASTARETDYWGVFLDCDNLKLYYTINGVIQNSGTGFDIQSGFYYHPAIGYYNTQAIGTSVNWGNGVFFSTLLTGTTYTDDDGIGMFKYSPNYGGGANFDGSAKNFYALCTKNLKAYGG